MPGLFIAIEGADGAGKTTAVNFLKEMLSDERITATHPFTYFRSPGGSPQCEKLRSVFLDSNISFLPKSELYLNISMHMENCENIVKPALLNNNVVLVDRYLDSTSAYQGAGRELMRVMNSFTYDLYENRELIVPNIVVIINCSDDVRLERLKSRGTTDRMEQQSSDFNKRVSQHFKQMTMVGSDCGNLTIIIENNGTNEELKEKCQKFVDCIVIPRLEWSKDKLSDEYGIFDIERINESDPIVEKSIDGIWDANTKFALMDKQTGDVICESTGISNFIKIVSCIDIQSRIDDGEYQITYAYDGSVSQISKEVFFKHYEAM